MKRLIMFIIAILTTSLLLGGCGGNQPVEVDIDDLSKRLLDSGIFTDLLSELDSDMAASLYELDAADISAGLLYCSTGATAEELAVFKAANQDAAKRLSEAVLQRVSFQISSYESYVPSEVPKLEQAVIVENGLYIVLCVSDDADTARSIIGEYL